jgi:hypothetical protein
MPAGPPNKRCDRLEGSTVAVRPPLTVAAVALDSSGETNNVRVKAHLGGPMKRYGVGMIAAAVLMSMASTASGQARTISSEMRTDTATVEAIESASRTVTLRKPDGTYVTVVAGPEIKRFAEIKVGDKVNARYYENVVIRLMTAGEAKSPADAKATTPSEMTLPGGTKARQRSITATITAIDMNMPAVTFTGPKGWKYSSKVQDKAALGKVKVGDQVEIIWTEAMLVSIEPGK